MRHSTTVQRGRRRDGLIRRAAVLSELGDSGSLALSDEEDPRGFDALEDLEAGIDHDDLDEVMSELAGGTRFRFSD
jgi:hypothetical protein